jgi:hypothetical protein
MNTLLPEEEKEKATIDLGIKIGLVSMIYGGPICLDSFWSKIR